MKISFNNIILPYKNPWINVTKSRNTNLAPLEKDTVTFTGVGNVFQAKDMHIAPSEAMCIKARINAEIAEQYLKHVLDRWVGPLTKKNINVSKKKQMPAFSYITGRKTPESIREKVVSKYSRIVRDEQEEFSLQLARELNSHFKFNRRQNVKSLYYEILGIIEKDQDKNQKFPPYKNIPYCLDIVLEKFISSGKINLNNMPNETFASIKKDILSLMESKYRPEEELNYDKKSYIKPSSMEGIKHYANDIVRARIIMNNTDREHTQLLFDTIASAAAVGDLKITSVENYVADESKLPMGKKVSDYEYIKSSKLRDFAQQVNAKYEEKPSKLGYMGIHINLDLSNGAIGREGSQCKGYSGEIQIVGRDVLKLKDIEDLCYKIKDNKSSYEEKYDDFANYFLKYYSKCDKQEFDNYTYALYLSQRELPPDTSSRVKFKSPKELGFKNIPKELDFNVLAEIKEDCERAYEAKLKMGI